jgi:hypothetical protein
MVNPPRLSREDRPADDGAGRQRTEVTAVEGVFRLPVHQEDLVTRNDTTAAPSRQRTAASVVVERLAHGDSIDGDRAVGAADGLPRQGEDALQHRHALGQIAARVEEARERLGWPHNDELRDVQRAGRIH